MSKFDGIDTEGVTVELRTYVSETNPQNQSSGMHITSREEPMCGRPRAIELTERVRPILDALYPGWVADNPPDEDFEFSTVRDACQRLLSRLASDGEIQVLLAAHDASPQLAAAQLHELVWQAASAQWATGHMQEAVLAGAKAVNSMLQTKTGRRDLSEVKLVQDSFGEKDPSPGRPRLRFPAVEDEQTRRSMQQGVLSFGVGCFQAIRNPVGHLPNDENDLSEQAALERLAALSLLARWIDEAVVEETDKA